MTELHALVNTYRAPPTTRPVIVTVTGVVQDGTDRKLSVQIRVTPSVAAPRGAGQAPTVVPPVRRQ